MSDTGSADAIITAAKAAISKLEDLDDELQDQIEAIKAAATAQGRALTGAEMNQIKTIEADDEKVATAIKELAIEGLIALNNSSDVAGLKQKLTSVNSHLTDTITRLKKIARTAATAAQVADG